MVGSVSARSQFDAGACLITVGVLTVSDGVSTGHRQDTSGQTIEEIVGGIGGRIAKRGVVPDERQQVADLLREWADEKSIDLILTTGGTGLGPRDVTPEATLDVIERATPGLPELMRMESARQNIHAVLSRGVCGTRGRTLILNLPGSPRGVTEQLNMVLPVLPHAIDLIKGGGADHAPPESPEGSHGHPRTHLESHGRHHQHPPISTPIE